MELPGRMLTEVQKQIINQNRNATNAGSHFTIQSRVGFVMLESQLIAKGMDPQAFTHIEIPDQDNEISGKRWVYLTIEVDDVKEYFIIQKRYLRPGETIISEFRYNNTNYVLFEPELPKQNPMDV